MPGFQIETIWSGLNSPTAVAFAPNGRVFVTERAGLVKTFDSVADPTPTIAADLRTRVHSVADRGLLGLAVDPAFPSNPYVYVAYVLDAPPGGTPPFYNDACPNAPNTNAKDGCPVNGRVSRLTVNAQGQMTGSEHVLIGGGFYCYQHQAHALDHLAFGPDGALYASSGDGAAATFTDWGQHSGDPDGVAPNACGDPPAAAGSPLQLPTTEGGALRSQDLRTSSDPVGGGGSIVRINPATGAALPTNPLIGGSTGDDRHVAYGLRNPFRFAFRPGTNELWVADVGWNTWEELNVLPNPTQQVRNFGWPCYEGGPRLPQWDSLNVNLCESLYQAGSGAVAGPYWSYRHNQSPDPARCGSAGSAMSALAFASSPPYPATYDGALFVGDYAKQCLWILRAGANGQPNPGTLQTLASGVFPVDLQPGPGGLLYYVDIGLGRVSRITSSTNEAPIARPTATPQFGALPLAVQFDGSTSTDADGPQPLQYAWDLDGDGAFDDSSAVKPSRTYHAAQSVTVRLRVTDGLGAAGIGTVQIQPGNRPPQVTIATPAAGTTWSAGTVVGFSGTATDPEDGSLTAEIEWSVVLHHCDAPSDCHEHPQIDRIGPSGSFDAPEHEYPAHLEFRASATDSRGLTTVTSRVLQPVTGHLTFLSQPLGLQLLAGAHHGPTPFTVTTISGTRVSVSAPTSQETGSGSFEFESWSDGGARSHEVVAGPGSKTLTARYDPDGVDRWWGTDRYASAAAVSRESFGPGANVAYVASGQNFPDALASAASAALEGGPVLLVQATAIPDVTAAELTRLRPDRIVVVGGTGSVSGAVEAALEPYTTGSVTRLGGPDRFATASAISAAEFGPGVNAAFVVNGLDYPDALTASPAAAACGCPVIPVRPTSIPASSATELARLRPDQIIVVGGTGVVSAAIAAELAGYTAGSVTRLAGGDRYATAAAVSRARFPPARPAVYVATGQNYPDALAAAVPAGIDRVPVLLVQASAVPPSTATELNRLRPAQIVVVGGPASVSDGVYLGLGGFAAGP